MVPVGTLYRWAEDAGIPVVTFPLPLCGSLSVMDGEGACTIGLDPGVCDGGVQERVRLSHEEGHCATGSFYNIHSPADLRQRHENRADKWSIRRLIPVAELDAAVAGGITEIWELADHFGVTEDLMRKAVCLYVHNNIAAELYF